MGYALFMMESKTIVVLCWVGSDFAAIFTYPRNI